MKPKHIYFPDGSSYSAKYLHNQLCAVKRTENKIYFQTYDKSWVGEFIYPNKQDAINAEAELLRLMQ